MVTFVWLVVKMKLKGVWRYARGMYGDLSVMTPGTLMMVPWSVSSWDIMEQVRLTWGCSWIDLPFPNFAIFPVSQMFPFIRIHTLEKVQAHITSPTWAVMEMNWIYWIATLVQDITVKEMMMQELSAMVSLRTSHNTCTYEWFFVSVFLCLFPCAMG